MLTFKLSDGLSRQINLVEGETVLDAARRAGVAIDSPCGGVGTCGKCRVSVGGEWVLSCSTLAESGMEVFVPPFASAFREMKISANVDTELAVVEHTEQQLKALGVTYQTSFTTVDITLHAPTLDDTTPDAERLSQSLAATLNRPVTLTLTALRRLPSVLRDNSFSASVCCSCGDAGVVVYDLAPQGKMRAYGLAIDIGTTGVAAMLVDIISVTPLCRVDGANAQIVYGADVISRIIESTRDGGLERLRSAIVDQTINPMLHMLMQENAVEPRQIVSVSVSANPTMTQLFLGVPSDPLRMEPYVPAFFEMDGLRAADCGLTVHADAVLKLAPSVGSYVGGDVTAGVLTTGLWAGSEPALFVDLGTNGELVYGCSDFMMACACSAGPAFEGGEIGCGMRASAGAIDACVIDADTFEPTVSVIGDGAAIGICGSGLIDLVAQLFIHGLIDGKGRFQRTHPRIVQDGHGIFRYIVAHASGSNPEVSLSEVDISSFIRAKAAIYSAIETMLEPLGEKAEDLRKIYVAGGIGGGINFDSAVAVGMFPDVGRECFEYVGNASLTGAFATLVSVDLADRLRQIGRGITYIDLSSHPDYMDRFINSCFLWR